MASHRIAAVVALALCACWGKPTPPPGPAPRPPAPIASKPRGIVLVAHVPPGKSDPVLFWNDLDANKTGELDRNVTQLLRPVTNATHATWFSSDDEQLRIARPPQGPGVVIAELTTDRIWAVSRDGKLAIIGCTNAATCSIGTLTDTGVLDDKGIPAIPEGIAIKAWLPDGRLVIEDRHESRLSYLDPKTETSTPSLKLVAPLRSITDDGSLIAWHVELSANRQVVRWKRLRDQHEMAHEVAGSSIDCRFTPASRVLYCIVAPATARRTIDEDDVPRNRLLLIDPAKATSRELAGDLPLLDTHFIAGSPDGRYVAYTANLDDLQRPMIVDLLSGETFPVGPPATHAYVVGWLAPR